MSQQYINIGSTPNDGLGDPIRTAFQKTNQNFSELYANSGNGGGNVNFSNVSSSIIPSANITYSLGNSTNWWANAWFGSNTIYIGGIPIGVTGNILTVGGNAVVTTGNTGNTVLGNIIVNGIVSATGNVQGNYILGNGALLTGVSGSSDANVLTGNTLSSNVTLSSLTQVGTLGNLNVSGNILTTGLISTTGNINATNFIGNLSNGTSKISIASNGNISVGVGPFSTTVLNINTSTGISVLGNVVASQAVSAIGNITGGNITATDQLTFANLVVSGGAPLVATDTTIAFKIPVVINGTTYYISLTAAQ